MTITTRTGRPGDALVYDAVRTPRGRTRRQGGTLADVPAHELFAGLLRELSARGVPPEAVDDVVVGVSTVVGEQAGDVPRVAVIAAGWPDDTPGGVVSRMCCSGLDAIAAGAAQVASGAADVVVTGGAESMTRVPILSDRPAFLADAELGDLTGFVTIGVSADLTAAVQGFGRDELDAFAVRSHQRAAGAPTWSSVVPVTVDGVTLLAVDEGARADTTTSSLATLPPLFGDDPSWPRVEARFPGFTRPPVGLHTVATAPQLSDAASAAVLGSALAAERLGRPAVGRVVSWCHTAVRSPGLDGTVPAAHRALERAGITVADLAVVECNESFAVTPLLLARELGLDLDGDVLNAHGGAVALGHPLGASGGILLANAMELLTRRGGGFGLLVIPAALGIATAVVVEAFA